MPKREPLYPHIPKSRVSKSPAPPDERVKVRILPDSREQIVQSIYGSGYKEKLATAFLAAIERGRSKR